MYYLKTNNLHVRDRNAGWEMGDVVDTMNYDSAWSSGLSGCDQMGDVGVNAGVGVGASGLRVNAGGNVSLTWLLIAGVVGYFVFFKKGRL